MYVLETSCSIHIFHRSWFKWSRSVLNDEVSFYLFYGYHFDASIISGPLFCTIIIKSIGSKQIWSGCGPLIELSQGSVCIVGLSLERVFDCKVVWCWKNHGFVFIGLYPYSRYEETQDGYDSKV